MLHQWAPLELAIPDPPFPPSPDAIYTLFQQVRPRRPRRPRPPSSSPVAKIKIHLLPPPTSPASDRRPPAVTANLPPTSSHVTGHVSPRADVASHVYPLPRCQRRRQGRHRLTRQPTASSSAPALDNGFNGFIGFNGFNGFKAASASPAHPLGSRQLRLHRLIHSAQGGFGFKAASASSAHPLGSRRLRLQGGFKAASRRLIHSAHRLKAASASSATVKLDRPLSSPTVKPDRPEC